MTKILYVDCFSGISGDMMLGALIDVGVPLAVLKKELAKLPISSYRIRSVRDHRHHLWGHRVTVSVPKGKEKPRTFRHIREMIEGSGLKEEVKETSVKVFERIAEAEAKIHRKKLKEIHFHEVGAIDSIVDIVGCAVGVEYLGVRDVYASRVPLGSGFVRSQHGTLPVPAPATVQILKGIPVYSGKVDGELVTPTGAALITTLTNRFGEMPPMSPLNVGYGVGSKDFREQPNLLRVVLGEHWEGFEGDRVSVLESNLDDMNPEWLGYLMEKLFEEGALDVSFSPLQMKKNRPGVLLRVICQRGEKDRLARIILEESTTSGLRHHEVERIKLPRGRVSVETRYGTVQAKSFTAPEGRVFATPEFESCRKLAKKSGVPLKEVYKEAEKALAKAPSGRGKKAKRGKGSP